MDASRNTILAAVKDTLLSLRFQLPFKFTTKDDAAYLSEQVHDDHRATC